MKTFIGTSLIIIALYFFYSCSRNPKKKIDTNQVYKDKVMLGKILDLKTFKPETVLFKYRPILNSIEGEQPWFLPAPKDYVLEAVLFFNPETIQKLKAEMQSKAKHTKNEKSSKEIFIFSWLPDTLKKEILKSETLTEYPADVFFNTGTSEMIILKDKVVLYALTN